MYQDKQLPNPEFVCTFGSARLGDNEFAKSYNKIIQQTTYENELDIIPFLPPGNQVMVDIMMNVELGSESESESSKEILDMVDDFLWSKQQQQQKLYNGNGRQQLPNKKNYYWTYQPVGNRRYIHTNSYSTTTNGTTITTITQNVTKEIDSQRIKDIETKTLLKFSEFRSAHCSSSGTRTVQKSSTPTAVCRRRRCR
eukprot:CAMPEP_0171007904 /NCGR_PEP_ID=MMETSP0736-20130129/20140_1 /TAXON_ID=186038 /ORGANISM="Fragilariopsis kerguelensis, Strain L26-C5" /LENGTH=196 /DNA_ID=CAMNT_0011438689 /DNA_START=777 /DNA_END=1363 /DNA_ORIENTATION=-